MRRRLMRAVIYTRISNDPTGQQLGVSRQAEDCQALAERLGWEVTATFDDNDLSAFNGKTRPGFEAMLSAIKRSEVDALIVWHTDRLYRTLKDLVRLLDVSTGIEIRTVQGGSLDLSTSTGKMLATIVGSVSFNESEHKGERQRRANVQRAAAGSWWSSNRCFGYTQTGEPLEPEASMIRQAAADILAGTSLRAIARQWNDSGVSSVRGAAWTTPRIKRTLINPRYAALRSYRGKVVGPGDWTAILDPDTHAGLVAVLRDPTRGPAVSYERKYIGSHRYICGICKAPMHHTQSSHAHGRAYHQYKCIAAAHLSRTQPELDAYVEAVVLAYLRDDTKLHALLAERENTVDVDELRTRRAALQEQRDELATLFTDGVLDGPGVRRESAKISAKISGIDTALAEVARRNPVADLVKDGPEQIEKRWAALSPDLKGKIVDEVCTVVVNPSPRGRYFRPECIDIVPKVAL